MPEGLATADGTAIDLDQAEADFHRAMAAPEPDEPIAPAPPKRAPADPEAPFGRKLDGTAKKAPGGRPAKPRVTQAPAAAEKPSKPGKGPGQAATGTDYTQPLSEFTSALWMVAASAPIPPGPLRLKVRAQALVLRENQTGLVRGVAMMAQHNGTIRRGVEMLCLGEAGWVLPACMALAPFAVQSSAVWRAKPELLGEMAAQTEEQWAEEFKAMQAQMGIGQAEDEHVHVPGDPPCSGCGYQGTEAA